MTIRIDVKLYCDSNSEDCSAHVNAYAFVRVDEERLMVQRIDEGTGWTERDGEWFCPEHSTEEDASFVPMPPPESIMADRIIELLAENKRLQGALNTIYEEKYGKGNRPGDCPGTDENGNPVMFRANGDVEPLE